jgi:exodeoxyribonuclease V gamma subunit
MALTVHRAERADVLADVLAEQLAVPLADPLARELVVVPARGVERWLSQRLAQTLGAAGHRDGIAANIDFPSPEDLLQSVVAATADEPDAARTWYSGALVWPVLAVLDAHLDDPRMSVLRNHLAGPTGRGRRLAAASTIAGLLRGYGWQRPGMLAAWATGADTDGAGGVLPAALNWQPWFWREVRSVIGQPHPAERLDGIVERLAADPDAVDLPPRLGFFGPTRVPEALRVLLRALSADREVSLFVPHPSDALWAGRAEHLSPVPRPRRGAATPEGTYRPQHPLLASLSRDVRELQEVLAPLGGTSVHHSAPDVAGPPTLLGAVQEGLRRDQLLVDGSLTADDTLEVHACHGPERQVEVLRERLLRLFDDHPGLQPRDVLVMCPDVEAFAPLIQAAFDSSGTDSSGTGSGELDGGRPRHPAAGLRVRLADRGLRETNEVLDVVAVVLDMAADRVRAGDLIDLLGQPAVARCFGFSDDDLEHLSGWVDRAGIRWGIDATQRDRFGMSGFPQGTAATGRDRLLLGVLAEESGNEWLGVGLPLDGIESTKIDVAGRFAEFIDRLAGVLRAMNGRRAAGGWAELLVDVIDKLTEPDRESQWHRGQAISMVTDTLGAPEARDIELGLSDVRDQLAALLAARPSRSNFCTGELTVCTLTPMRSVPHRVIVLLGMDTGVFPRSAGIDGDDILGLVPLVGERDWREEDREVFLDSIGAAAEHLLVFYSGADPVTGAAVPAPVVISELIDVADRVLGLEVGAGAVVQRHTLHAFDDRNFRVTDGGPRSYDGALVAGARALAQVNVAGEAGAPPPRLGATVLPALAPGDVDLDELTAFFKDPVGAFVRERLGVRLPEHDEGHNDELDIDLDGLQKWKVGDRHLHGVLAGASSEALRNAELRRGSLPPFALGSQVLGPIEQKAEAIGTVALSERGEASRRSVDVRVALPGGRRLYGTVADVFGDTLVEVSYSSLKPEHRLLAWIRLLALGASGESSVREAVVIGADWRGGALLRRIAAPENAAELLQQLIAIRDAGLRAPLWLPPQAAEMAGQMARRPRLAINRVYGLKDFVFDDKYAGLVLYDDPQRRSERADVLALAGAAPFLELEGVLPAVDADGELSGAQRSFVRMAAAVFGPLLPRESQR